MTVLPTLLFIGFRLVLFCYLKRKLVECIYARERRKEHTSYFEGKRKERSCAMSAVLGQTALH